MPVATSLPREEPCRQTAKPRESYDKSAVGPVPYQATFSRQN